LILPILRGPARGLRLSIDFGVGGEGSYILGRHESAVTQQLAGLIQPDWTVWDCGSHIGFFTVLFGRAVGPKGRVIAFEPDPNKLERVRRNVQLNQFSWVECVGVAIAGEDEVIRFRVQPAATSHVVGAYVGREPPALPDSADLIEVPAITLDAALQAFPQPNLVKLDIEGSELIALQHATRLLAEVRPLLAIELHNPEADALVGRLATQHRYDIFAPDGQRILDRERVGGHVLLRPAT
jgi:FkbM family methyltransferase